MLIIQVLAVHVHVYTYCLEIRSNIIRNIIIIPTFDKNKQFNLKNYNNNTIQKSHSICSFYNQYSDIIPQYHGPTRLSYSFGKYLWLLY